MSANTAEALRCRVSRPAFVCLLVAFAPRLAPAWADPEDEERELRAIHASLDDAFLRGDVDHFDRIYAPEYRFSHHFGRLVSRADNLAFLRSLATHPPYKVVKATSEDVRVRVLGDAAWVTARWIVAAVPVGQPSAQPHEDHGLYTGIYERRGGRWLLVGEHMSEAFHDPARMKREVETASRQFRGFLAEPPASDDGRRQLRAVLGEDSRHGLPDGRLVDRAAFMAALRPSGLTEVREQSLQVLDNNVVVETGTLRDPTSSRAERYTVTWLWRELRWQVAATHRTASAVERPLATGASAAGSEAIAAAIVPGASSAGQPWPGRATE